jgi:hypothetical protein
MDAVILVTPRPSSGNPPIRWETLPLYFIRIIVVICVFISLYDVDIIMTHEI